MDDLKGKRAFITGGSEGIGYGIARALAREGVHLVIAALNQEKLDAAAAELREFDVDVTGHSLDVADRDAFHGLASAIENGLGNIHILVNNAGVGFAGAPLQTVKDDDWDWVIGVNLRGAINGVQAFLPGMMAHGEPAHIVNTSSIAGLFVKDGWGQGVYATTRFGIVAFSEALRMDLADQNIGVSVLCPGPVNTDIYQSGRNRPDRHGAPFRRPDDHPLAKAAQQGMSIDTVGHLVVEAIRSNDAYIITHPEFRTEIEARHRSLMEAHDVAAARLADI